MAQMVESTFMAPRSYFFALAGVVDRFAEPCNGLSSVLGLFGLVRWPLLTGRTRGARNEMHSEFRKLLNGRLVQVPLNVSKKPLVFFLLAIKGGCSPCSASPA
ncbi:hypothetical protein V8E53_010769 [Lactarius tabidus]